MGIRHFTAVVALLFATPALAVDAKCEYRHPGHPSWDFFAACSYDEEVAQGRVTTSVRVANGSRFTTVAEEVAGGGTRYSVNGLAATRLERGESRCYRTDAEAELICIHPVDTEAPAAPAAPPAAVPAAAAPAGFGGGRSGFCLLSQDGPGGPGLVEYGACVKRENCLVDADGGTSCLTEFDWKSGRVTEMARTDDWHTLDGGEASAQANGCFVDAAVGLQFCYSPKAMTAARYPVLAADPQ